jgi:hypothetical protein
MYVISTPLFTKKSIPLTPFLYQRKGEEIKEGREPLLNSQLANYIVISKVTSIIRIEVKLLNKLEVEEENG